MNSRALIKHPGAETAERLTQARGNARKLTVTLPAGSVLMDAVANAMDKAGCDSGIMVLDGLQMGDYRYVMPGPSHDGVHAAWYSEMHEGRQSRLHHATAIVGRNDGAWWLHCHAMWDSETTPRCGHLLPNDVMIASDATVTLLAFEGGVFDVALNEETQFSIFHARGGQPDGNAVIAKLHPHEDIHTAISDLIRAHGFARAEVFGIGSLIGAQFATGMPMASPISEVLIEPGARWDGKLHLPMYCVDPDNGQFRGDIVPGTAPVCVTFELMIIADS